MALLRLQNIGKIYVSEGNVTVGIRGVNLSFEKGEFVAITGASGSGKSTLLNVLSGMDTYEEGELFIEEQPTSHYLQPDWEEYREKYISFIFQDYNIIDSFTVLQNVELALMTIPDPAKRRRRAMELIERVGLTKHVRHKGSQLSGGQKQRTVIARALAKDSPIILADEPTGNLDSETSKEIIELLREIAKDKLLIMVTHSFDQVEHVATRHIRVFDGSIESDRVMTENAPAPEEPAAGKADEAVDVSAQENEETAADASAKGNGGSAKKAVHSKVEDFSNGFLLGRSMFCAKPRLSIFLRILMIVGIFGVFFATAVCGEFAELFHKYHIFRPMDGRLVIAHKDGRMLTDDELKELSERFKANGYIHCDILMDANITDSQFALPYQSLQFADRSKGEYRCSFGEDFGKPDLGRYPETSTEVLLNVPIYYKPVIGEDKIIYDKHSFYDDFFKVVGVKYYADTNVTPTVLFTEEGFRYATCLFMLHDGLNLTEMRFGSSMMKIKEFAGGKYDTVDTYFDVKISRAIAPDQMIFDNVDFQKDVLVANKITYGILLNTTFQKYRKGDGYTIGEMPNYFTVWMDYDIEDLTFPGRVMTVHSNKEIPLLIGTEVAQSILEETVRTWYMQGTLMFDSNRAAEKAAKELNKENFVALTTDETYKPDYTTILSVILNSLFFGIVWIIIVFFIAFFINLCSNRTIAAFREDMTIMRSMGIPVRVIRIGIYVRMFLSQVAAFILLPITAYIVYHTPRWNAQLIYLEPIHYVIIYLGMIILMYRVTRKQLRNLFGASVKTSLRGGEDA